MILGLMLTACFTWRSVGADSKDSAIGEDLDGDGYVSTDAGGDDCWDDPDAVPPEYIALNDFAQLTAADVHPGAVETWYDAIDQDCDGGDDFDQDGDGHASAYWSETRGQGPFDDCYDGGPEDYPGTDSCDGVVATMDPADVHPSATDEWYDGTDADCDGTDDYDQDGDGFPLCEDCDDEDATWYPMTEVWYDGIDQDCDGNDGDQDGDGYESTRVGGDDCWDAPDDVVPALNELPSLTEADVHPGATETWYDGIDGDCAGDGDFDQDGDGSTTDAWPDAEGVTGDDCDDLDDSVHPGAEDAWYDDLDADCAGNDDNDADTDGYADEKHGGTDCDDEDPAISPGMVEDCATDADDDCDGGFDEDGAVGCSQLFLDADGDGVNGDTSGCWCEAPDGYIPDVGSRDCDDTDLDAYPGAPELVGDGVDQDCDAGDLCYLDADNDGHTDESGTTIGSLDLDCDDEKESAVATTDDCDDTDAKAYTGAEELVGDEVDEDCDGAERCGVDADVDGHASMATWVDSADLICGNKPGEGPPGQPVDDCNDGDASVNPGAVETPGDGVDSNCDEVDDCYADLDLDGYTPGSVIRGTGPTCTNPGELAAVGMPDCDDSNASVHPGAIEVVADDVDEDCDGSEQCYVDADQDKHGGTTIDAAPSTRCSSPGYAVSADDCDDFNVRVYPGAPELCDLVQNDCTATSWTSADEIGLVTVFGDDGTITDATATFAAGTSTSPVSVSPGGDGEAWVCQGTYYVTIAATSIDLSIIGAYGATETVLDGAGAGPILEADRASVYFRGVTLQGGIGRSSGPRHLGGAVYATGNVLSKAEVSFQDCEIVGNTADDGGAVYAEGYSDVWFFDTYVSANSASRDGGALWVDSGSTYCAGETTGDYGFFDNVAGHDGGAVYFGAGSGTFEYADCDFDTNAPQDVASVSPTATNGIGLGYDAAGYCTFMDGCL